MDNENNTAVDQITVTTGQAFYNVVDLIDL